jgi:hydrogenase maturation protease
MRKQRILIAGIGNIFLGDDAFGSEVAREMMRLSLPEGVSVSDFGIRSYDLAYALMDGVDAAILVDDACGEGVADAHSMNVVSVLRMVRSLGGEICKVYLVGCEPASLETEDGRLGLSETVRAAVPRAIEMIQSLLTDFLCERQSVKTN